MDAMMFGSRLGVKLAAVLRELAGLVFHSIFQHFFLGDVLLRIFPHVSRDFHAASVVKCTAAAKAGISPGESPNVAGGARCAKLQIVGKGFTPLHHYVCAAMIGVFATVPSAVNMISPTRHDERRA
jgi:hypothetical protein